MQFIQKYLRIARESFSVLLSVNKTLDDIKINQGRILAELQQRKVSENLQDYEFKVFSQWGEDGMLQRLTQILDIPNKTFIEFGVEDFLESNCRFLLMKDNWQGFVIDGSEHNINRLKKSYFYWGTHLEAVHSFVTRENINALLHQSGFDPDLGILSIDLDGVDYYVLEAIDFFKPRILVCEYNAVLGGDRKISVPYRPDFQRTKAHYSNLYWGASLLAMTHLAEKKGYVLVGTTTARNNAFYVRRDLLNGQLQVLSARKAYAPSHARESRDSDGRLTFLSGDKRLDVIKGLPVVDIETGVTIPL